MGFTLPKNGSLEFLIEYCVNAAAALNARKETRHLAAPWRQLVAVLKQARDARDVTKETWIEAIAIYKVTRLEWNEALAKLSGETFHLAGKKARQEPYVGTFGGSPAAKTRSFGASRATQFGSLLLTRLGVINHPELAESTAAFETVQTALVAASADRRRAFEAYLAYTNHRTRLASETQSAIHTTEVNLLTLFPGNRDRVRVVLAPSRADERKEGRESEVPPSA